MTHSRLYARTLLAALLLAVPAFAQNVDSVFRDFHRTGDFILMVDGKAAPNAEIYKSDVAPAYLILTSALPSPVLLTPRAMAVETVSIMKVAKQKDGTVDLLADAQTVPQGQIRLEGEKVLFNSEGHRLSLNPRPPLLGARKSTDLRTHSPEYVAKARGYTPNGQAVAALRKETRPVRVRVFFGSWCPHCKEHLPYLMRVEEELKKSGSKMQFDYYGLPPGFGNEPEAKKFKVSGVPLGIVYVNGREVGRISGGAWSAPDVALRNILNGGATAKGR